MKAIVAVVSTAVLLFGGERVLVWSDEFDYSGLPDPTKWDYDVGNGGWGNNEIQNYMAKRVENGRAENGSLILEARRDWFSGIEYSSARLVTRNKGDWKYGRVEVRAKVPLGQGLWPAIWMLPTDWKYGGWPKSGEIDIMESFALGGIKPNQIDGNIHTEAYNHSIGTNKGAPIKNLSTIDANFHVYAIDWNAERIDFSVDGTVYFSFANEHRTSAEWPFDQRFHLILNIAVGGSLGLTPDPSIFPKQMIVDWVRVYQDAPERTSSVGAVTLFENESYGGFSAGTGVGSLKSSDLSAKGIRNGMVKSIRSAPGFRTVLYSQDQFRGDSLVITSDRSALTMPVNSVKISTAGATVSERTVLLRHRSSGKFFDILGGPSAVNGGIRANLWDSTGGSNQQVELKKRASGVYALICKHSGKALDVVDFSQESGAEIIQWDSTGTVNQQFLLVGSAAVGWKLVALHSGKVIDGELGSKGAKLRQYGSHERPEALWDLVDIQKVANYRASNLREPFSVTIANRNLCLQGLTGGFAMVSLYRLDGKLMYRQAIALDQNGAGIGSLESIGAGAAVVEIRGESGLTLMKKIAIY